MLIELDVPASLDVKTEHPALASILYVDDDSMLRDASSTWSGAEIHSAIQAEILHRITPYEHWGLNE